MLKQDLVGSYINPRKRLREQPNSTRQTLRIEPTSGHRSRPCPEGAWRSQRPAPPLLRAIGLRLLVAQAALMYNCICSNHIGRLVALENGEPDTQVQLLSRGHKNKCHVKFFKLLQQHSKL
ncbi:hypothetical protein T4E_9337 [Trichinella pseudospiralis]|uniref:Uncharacterized protein n=1 Tax=Trichinella pseudospiralis TaxID=6337 RepID=A0A0V0Y7G5_TRIPS|nr:hypothetical protein T4E_9337 [Trichinella pseudospiralis]